MTLYEARIQIEDDPAWFGATVLIVADNQKEALEGAKAAALQSYHDHAGGWASGATKVVEADCAEITLPDKGVVLVSGDYER